MKLLLDKTLDKTPRDVYKHAYLHLMHEKEQLKEEIEQLKNELWRKDEIIKRTRKDIERLIGVDTNDLYVSSVSRIER